MRLIALLLVVILADDHPLPADRREAITKEADATIASQTEAIKKEAGTYAYSSRGDAYFKRGKFAEALADYEKMVELDASLDKSHWRRGIAAWYAGKYEAAARQFEIYHTFDDVDRENGIWRYFSQYKAYGREKAQAGLLQYAKDDRQPFPSVYKLFEGKMTAEQVVESVESAKISDDEKEMRRFYASLYIGLNASLEGHKELAIKHLRAAVANKWGPSGGYGPEYMWHVGRVHYDLLTVQK